MAHRIINVGDSEPWDGVMPGDLVCCPGTQAFHLNKWMEPDHDVNGRVLSLSQKRYVLIVSRIPGILGSATDMSEHYTSFIAMSRHGLLVIIQTRSTKQRD